MSNNLVRFVGSCGSTEVFILDTDDLSKVNEDTVAVMYTSSEGWSQPRFLGSIAAHMPYLVTIDPETDKHVVKVAPEQTILALVRNNKCSRGH